MKRAYVRGIKRYRPETHPEEFKRVRCAYEQALDSMRLEWFLGHVETLGEGQDVDGIAAPPIGSTHGAPLIDVETAECRHRPAERDTLAAAKAETRPVADPRVVADDHSAMSRVAAQLETAIAEAEPARIRYILGLPELARARLCDERFDEAIDRALCVLVWDEPTRAAELRSGFGLDSHDVERSGLANEFASGYLLNSTWRVVAPKCPPALSRWIRTSAVLGFNDRAKALRRLAAESKESPVRLLEAIDTLIMTETSAIYHYLRESLAPHRPVARPDPRSLEPFVPELASFLDRLRDDQRQIREHPWWPPSLLGLLVVVAFLLVFQSQLRDETKGALYCALTVVAAYTSYELARLRPGILWDHEFYRARIHAAIEIVRHDLSRPQLWQKLRRQRDELRKRYTPLHRLRCDPSLELIGIIASSGAIDGAAPS
ncbi:MAG: hypothetical protein KC609_06055 [Myxococcales bacterium]|nr:hypothetical protein [Myxococcales bacterium]